MIKKLGLALILAVGSSGVLAEWERVGGNHVFDFYVNRDTIRKSGTTVKMWNLFDNKVSQRAGSGKKYRSSKSQVEYDCSNDKRRVLYFSLHTEKMGGGDVISVDDEVFNWTPVPPGSMVETSWKVACDRE